MVGRHIEASSGQKITNSGSIWLMITAQRAGTLEFSWRNYGQAGLTAIGGGFLLPLTRWGDSGSIVRG